MITSEPLPAIERCPAKTRSQAGYQQCHKLTGHDGDHHTADRSWPASTLAWPQLRLGRPCDPDCAYRDDGTLPYLGASVPTSAGPKTSWPTLWPKP